jgi:hypothetical protein
MRLLKNIILKLFPNRKEWKKTYIGLHSTDELAGCKKNQCRSPSKFFSPTIMAARFCRLIYLHGTLCDLYIPSVIFNFHRNLMLRWTSSKSFFFSRSLARSYSRLGASSRLFRNFRYSQPTRQMQRMLVPAVYIQFSTVSRIYPRIYPGHGYIQVTVSDFQSESKH